MPTLKASRLGIARIKQARKEKGWTLYDPRWLIEASKVLEPNTNWELKEELFRGISEGTWKRWGQGKSINAPAFKAYCEVLGLNWEEIVEHHSSTIANTHQDWGEAIDISTFYGRTVELTELEHWIVTDRCRIVTILGMGGIGKTSLSVKLAEQIQPSFEYLIWRSLRNAPPVQELLADLIEFLSDGQETELQPTVEGRVSQLIEYLRKHRCLLLLDDVEIVLRSGGLAGQYREGYQGYGELIRRVGQERHQSCLVLTSREKPIEIASLAGATLPVRALRVKGLPKEDARKILEAKGFSTLKRGWEELIALYRGNPLALKIIATTIQEIFNGDISQFLDQSTLVLGDILPSLLYQQFERLSDLEKGIIYCVAIETEPISIPELKSDLRFSGASLSELLSALESLKRRSLLEEEPSTEGSTAFLTLQPVIRKYVTNQLIEQVCKDILTVAKNQSIDKLGLLRSHALLKEQEEDNVREIHFRLIVRRVMDRLHVMSRSANSVEQQLHEVLILLKGQSPQAVGYAKINILNLLRSTEDDLQQAEIFA
ncbi:MAG TPA: hypothetical protein DCE56_43380 [Cyanobacteria bacterium UBA8553]|nr:hypothetical protein [Cyanobacteria bacterium UBA8553]